MADEKAKQAETKKSEEKDVMPKPLNTPKPTKPQEAAQRQAQAKRQEAAAERKMTRPETTQAARTRAADDDNEVPPGHSARTIVLSDVQWAAIDRMVARGNTTPGRWLRQFLAPYLR